MSPAVAATLSARAALLGQGPGSGVHVTEAVTRRLKEAARQSSCRRSQGPASR